MIRRAWGWWASLIAVMLLLGGAALLYWGKQQVPAKLVLQIPCGNIEEGCGLPEHRLLVRFDRHPHPMQLFQVEVNVPDAREVHVGFTMRDMQMGMNRYQLLPDGVGAWKADVTLPVCIQGRSDWELRLDVDGRVYLLPFSAG